MSLKYLENKERFNVFDGINKIFEVLYKILETISSVRSSEPNLMIES